MRSHHYFRVDTASALVPWIVATVSVVLAFVLLSHFVAALNVQMQRGQALRAGPNAAAVSNIELQSNNDGVKQTVASVE